MSITSNDPIISKVLETIQKKMKNQDDIIFQPQRTADTISTGSLIMDNILGGGLLIQGRMSEISGLEGSGKTTFCFQSAGEAIKRNKKVVFFDFEQTFHTTYAREFGLEQGQNGFLVVQPNNLEEGLQILRELENIMPDNDTVLIFDSIAAMKPRELLEKAGEQQRIGIHAQRIGELSGYLSSVWCGRKKSYILMTNQIRKVPGTGSIFQAKSLKDSGLGFGASGDTSNTTTGGVQLRYMLSLRVLLDYAGKIEEGSYNDGNLVRSGSFVKAFTIKNKICPPFQTAKLAILYGKGFVDDFAILDTLRNHGYIQAKGSVLHYYDTDWSEIGTGMSFKVQGKEKFYAKLKEPEYKESMLKTFKKLMQTDEAVEITGESELEAEQDYKETDVLEPTEPQTETSQPEFDPEDYDGDDFEEL